MGDKGRHVQQQGWGYGHPPNQSMQQGQITSQPMHSMPPRVAYPIVSTSQKRGWNYGLFDCMSNLGVCCCGYWCAPCQMWSNVRRLGDDPINYLLLACCLGMPMSIAMRSLAREKMNIEGGYDRDVVAGVCCSACVSCQVANELNEAEKEGIRFTD